MRTARALYVEALDALLHVRMAEIAVARDWELLREMARLAQQDAPLAVSSTDPHCSRVCEPQSRNITSKDGRK